MFRSDSPFGFESSSYAGSIKSNGYSTMDEVSSQVSSLSRPSGKSIYLQRKEYATSINKMMDNFQYRVEHLFTCDLDGRELRNVTDCVERLMLLDQMGRVWGQNMQLEVRGTNLVLTDIETKEELESVAFADIRELKAVLNTGAFSSLLTVVVQQRRKRFATVFLFQCDDVRADYMERNLSQAMSRRRNDPGISSERPPERDRVRPVRNIAAPRAPEPADDPAPHWTPPDYDDDPPVSEFEEVEIDFPPSREEIPTPQPSFHEDEPPSPPRLYTELDRDVDILNHILSELEIFMGRVAAVEAKKSKKKNKKKGKAKKGMPTEEEFAELLHKIKYGFNILAELNGQISDPGAPEFVHVLFSALAFIVSHCAQTLPPTIVAPLLIPQAIRLMSEEATTEEDQLWQSLGDAWNIPSTQWPDDDEDIPVYTLQFFDGWQPPEVNSEGDPNGHVSRLDSPQSPRRQNSTRTPQRSLQKPRPGDSNVRSMRVKFDFTSRNHQELTVMKGELVDLLDTSKQWWKVRNGRGEDGYVPNNLLEDPNLQTDEDFDASPILTRKSRPAEVKAWLIDKGFSEITVRCLGILSGSMLLGMPREELKMVCPEEGGRVFFQLQAVKSALMGND